MALVQTSEGSWLNADAAASYEAMNKAFRAHFGYNLSINSGARTYDQQVTAFKGSYNPYYTVAELGRVERRWWNGQWWYRKPWVATVAVPGTSNHEYPPGKAADFGSGVQNMTTPEFKWMRANAGDYGWEWTGGTFSTIEPWHWEKNFAWSGTDPKPLPIPPTEKEIRVDPKKTSDAGAPKGKRVLKSGQSFYLNETLGAPSNTASNVVGKPGEYSFVVHVYAEGAAAGDSLIVKLWWDDVNTTGPNSGHYEERLDFGRSGRLRANIPFVNGVSDGTAVYASVEALSNNNPDKAAKVTLFVVDAWRFVAV